MSEKSYRKTHWTILKPWEDKKVSKLRFIEFRHQIESALHMAEFNDEVKRKRQKTAQEWLNWLIKTYKERNEESL